MRAQRSERLSPEMGGRFVPRSRTGRRGFRLTAGVVLHAARSGCFRESRKPEPGPDYSASATGGAAGFVPEIGGDAGLGVVREGTRVRKRANAAGIDRHR